ncbi:hypothetical protein [Dongia sp.]|uniref:hypothetical protein n=1 Tax=Dongia sp. TaxID=1977262 RepID=UPI0035B028ED
MSRSLQFRHCVHRGSSDGDVSSIVAAIRGDVCAPRPLPRAVDAVIVFRNVAHVIGPHRLAELWQVHRQEGRAEARDPRAFASFLAGEEVGRIYPALPDLARLDLGLFLAGMEDREPSIGACCLPADLIAGHPDLMLRLQPSFRYLSLIYPIHAWTPNGSEIPNAPAERPVLLRLAPDRLSAAGVVSRETLTPSRFAFECALARGHSFVAATKLARLQDPTFDGLAGIAALIDDGAIADVILHTNVSKLPKGDSYDNADAN